MEEHAGFHFNTNIGALLIKQCEVTSTQALIAACLAALVVSTLFECLRFSRAWLMNRSAGVRRRDGRVELEASTPTSCCDEARDTEDVGLDVSACANQIPRKFRLSEPRNKPLSWAHVTQTLLHVLQVTLGYLFMLTVMTYHVLLGVAIVLGAGLGYFIFAGFMVRDFQPPQWRNRVPVFDLKKLALGQPTAASSEDNCQELLGAEKEM